MVRFLGVVANILVDDIELPEHQLVFDKIKKTVQCFVPSEPGKEFVVQIARDKSGKEMMDLNYSIYCDGSKKPITRKTILRGKDCSKVSGMRQSTTTCRPLIFSELATTDDYARVSSSAPTDPGNIRVEVWRVRVHGPLRYVPYKPSTRLDKLDDNTIVHEQSKKAGGTKTSLGPLRAKSKYAEIDTKPYSPKDKDPFVTFVFLHRTEAMLKAMDIIPRTPPPVDLDDDSEDTESQKARIRELEIKLKVERSKLSSSKRQRVGSSQIKEEIQAHNIFQPGEIIDMTDL